MRQNPLRLRICPLELPKCRLPQFFKNPEYAQIFEGALDIDTLIMQMGATIPGSKFPPNKTIIILDEIQDAPNARAALKFFKEDGRYDIIGTGSFLGVQGYGKAPKSIPVGSEMIITMYPLDFEEFLWANGIQEPVFKKLRECFEQTIPVPEAIHNRMRQLLLQYTVVGGMPEVVQEFANTHQMDSVFQLQEAIVNSYRDDMVKYASTSDKVRIRECFDSIPNQLAKENKKFQYSLIEKRDRRQIRRMPSMDRRHWNCNPLQQPAFNGTPIGRQCGQKRF